MEAALPTIEAIQEIESRQDEVLRKLDALENRIAQTLASFGDLRFVKSSQLGTRSAELSSQNAEPLARAA